MLHERLRQHFEEPRNAGELPCPPALKIEVENPACGDILQLFVRYDGDTVQQVRYKVRGCAASIATGSALTEMLAGQSKTQIAAITRDDIEIAVGELAEASKHAAVLCHDAVKMLVRALR